MKRFLFLIIAILLSFSLAGAQPTPYPVTTWYTMTSKPAITVGDTNYPNFASAVATLNASGTNKELIIGPGTHSVAANLTVNSNISLKVLKGATIAVANAVTLTINGPFEAGLYQVFSCAGTGKVDGLKRLSKLYPVWWGYADTGTVYNTTSPTTGQFSSNYVQAHHINFSEYCNVSGDWTATNCTMSSDTTNNLGSPTSALIKVTQTGASTGPDIIKTLAAPTNFSGKHIAVYFYLPDSPAGNTSNIQYVALHLVAAGATVWTNYSTINIYDYTQLVNYPGWHCVSFAANAMTTGAGVPDLTAVTQLRFYVTMAASTSANVTLGPVFAFTPPNAKGVMMLAMDGGYTGQLGAVNYANSKGIPVTLFVAPSLVGATGRLTLTQLQDLRNRGNLIANYAYDGARNWQDLTDAERINIVKINATYLQENGFGDGARILSPPGNGTQSDSFWRDIVGPLVDIPGGFNRGGSGGGHTLWNTHLIRSVITPGNITAAALATMLTRSQTYKTIELSLWHDPYGTPTGEQTEATWKGHCDAIATQIAAGTVEVMTPEKIHAGRVTTSVASLDATATPTASKIPIADGSGQLNSWIARASLTGVGRGTYRVASWTVNLADSTSYYIPDVGAPSSDINFVMTKNYILEPGTITAAAAYVYVGGTLGSNETASLYLRLNNTTNYLVSDAVVAVAENNGPFAKTDLAIAVVPGDIIQWLLTTPSYGTNPTTVRVIGTFNVR